MLVKLDTSMSYEQYKNANKIEFLFISDLLKDEVYTSQDEEQEENDDEQMVR